LPLTILDYPHGFSVATILYPDHTVTVVLLVVVSVVVSVMVLVVLFNSKPNGQSNRYPLLLRSDSHFFGSPHECTYHRVSRLTAV